MGFWLGEVAKGWHGCGGKGGFGGAGRGESVAAKPRG